MKFSVANSSVPRVGCFSLADSNGGGGELRFLGGVSRPFNSFGCVCFVAGAAA